MTGYNTARVSQESCCQDPVCFCLAGEWGAFEVRPRDPEFLTDGIARSMAGAYDRCDACWDMCWYVCEIPRQRQLSPTRIVDLAPARFRLCSYHAGILENSDPLARCYMIGSGQ